MQQQEQQISRAVIFRLILGVTILIIASACGSSSGCSSCGTMEKIPGGFPMAHRSDNGMQVRLASGGINFLEQNFSSLVTTLVPGGLTFDIPPTGCTGGNQKLCCGSTKCSATMTISSVDMTPTPKSTLKLNLRAGVKTSKIQFEQNIYLGWVTCDVEFDSAKSGNKTLGLQADMNLLVNASNNNKLEIKRGTTTLTDFDSGDINISGKWYCTVINWLKSLFKSIIETEISKMLDDTVDGMLKELPLGQEGRIDIGSLMSTFSPSTTGKMDMFVWAGGHAQAENSGMSVGMMSGFRAAQHNICVPNCEISGAKCSKPAKTAIKWSPSFTGNVRPHDKKAFDVGIGVHRQALNEAVYAMYSAGGLCLDVGTDTVSQLSSSTFAAFLPSLNRLTENQNTPLVLAIRPRQPPTVELGAGTWTKGTDGKPVIKEPLLKVKAKNFAIDLYVLIDERMVRLFTILTDLEVPALIYADTKGDLQPMIGDLKKALTNTRLENYDLMAEDPKVIVTLLPTIIALASSQLTGAIDPIALPDLSGIKLILDDQSITSVDNKTMLAIYAKLGITKTSPMMPSPVPPVETRVEIETLAIPPTDAFRMGPGFDPWGGPKVVLRVDTDVPPEHAGKEVMIAYRIDGGFYRAWTTGPRLVIQDPAFWLQGAHTVEVMARVKGDHRTLDPTPAKVRVVIDTVPPKVKLVRTRDGVWAEVEDLVSKGEDLTYSWSVDGQPYSAFGSQRELQVPAGAEVAVRVRDEVGNEGLGNTAHTEVFNPPAAGNDNLGGGCSMASGSAPLALLPLLLLLGVLLTARRRQS